MQRPSLTSIKNETTSEQTTKYKSRSQNIKVIVRVRPTLKSEFGKEVAVSCSDNKKTVTIDTTTNTVQSTLDGAFDEITTQDEIFQQIKDSVPSVLQGFNSTIFAYGQTGSGKTHTMFGSDWENLMMRNNGGFVHNIQTTYVGNVETDKNFSGLIPRTINHLFQEIQKEENRPQNFAVYCSFLQIYNEKIYDLLTEKSSSNSLMIRENKMDGIYVDGLTEYCVSSFEECLMLMQRGEKNRYIRHTSNNVKSSRSHTIFQLIVESTKADSSGKLQKAKLNLCDLAGSEKLNKSEDIVNAHLTELKNINLSLTTLGKVIHNLSLGQKLPIPYRESKLTRLLQDSLGGNTKTCLIATLAPTLDYVDETLNTLKFAERAKHVVTEVKANKIEAVDAELVNKLQKEIKYLKEILNIRRKGTSAINEVNNKLLILQHENEKLRQSHFSINEVERLMEENKAIKLELQQLKCDSQSERNGDGDQREFDATGGLSNYTGKTFVPVNKSIFEPKGDILDQINEKGPRQRSGGSLQSRKSSNNEIRDKNQSENIDSMLTGGPMNLRMGRVISQDGPTKTYEETSSSIFKALPLRIKGKSATNLRKDQVKPPVVESLADLKRKEQMRSLKRLQNLEEWQRQIKEKELGYDSCQARYSAVPSMSELTAGGSTYSKLPKVTKQLDFDKLYDPYKVRQDIERKYNSLPRSHNPVRNLKATEEYSKFRNIERNYF